MTILSVPYFMGDEMSGLVVPEPYELTQPVLPDGSPQERMAALYGDVASWVASADRPIVWAGDCVSIIGVLAGLELRNIHPTIVFFDAHGDFHTWGTSQPGSRIEAATSAMIATALSISIAP